MNGMSDNHPARYRVCGGRFFVNGEPVPMDPRVLKIGVIAAGLDVGDPCVALSDHAARLILHMERSAMLAELADVLRDPPPPNRAA